MNESGDKYDESEGSESEDEECVPTEGRYSREGASRPRKERLFELTCTPVTYYNKKIKINK